MTRLFIDQGLIPVCLYSDVPPLRILVCDDSCDQNPSALGIRHEFVS